MEKLPPVGITFILVFYLAGVAEVSHSWGGGGGGGGGGGLNSK